jgi:NADH-quinone oxidoreductase subunit I
MQLLNKFLKMITFPDLLKGLKITNKYIIKKKITEKYPEEKRSYPYRYRGRIHVTIDTCISCKLCEKACPEGCLKVYPPPKEIMKTDKRPAQFYFSQEHCLHCGMCVDACPTGSIHHSHEFEITVFNIKELLFDKEKLPYDMLKKQYRWNLIENVPTKVEVKKKEEVE